MHEGGVGDLLEETGRKGELGLVLAVQLGLLERLGPEVVLEDRRGRLLGVEWELAQAVSHERR